jgi:uncharacterized membrane-anchored protein YjiN (DUF445 family)
MTRPIGRWAGWSLLLALALALLGLALRETGAPFCGGLLLAFGEAALVGGLADWFAVRALFTHPFGLPFPHTAIIPRNRRRIVGEIRNLVLTEWLPKSMLVDRVQSFDFVGTSLVPLLGPLQPHLRTALQTLGRDLLTATDPGPLAGLLARGVGGSLEAERVRTFLADLVRRAREGGWLEPLLREWVRKLQQWAESPQSRGVIQQRLENAAGAYRERGWFKSFTYTVAEAFGGIDLDQAAGLLQGEIRQFAADQLTERGQMQGIVRDGLRTVERRLRDDPTFLEDVNDYIRQTAAAGTLNGLLAPLLASLRQEGLRALENPDSDLVGVVLGHADRLLERVVNDAGMRERVNGWCRRLAVSLIERHHAVLGTLVEEQLERLSDERLTDLIEARVGEDLNWIRLNGTFVGGLIGTGLYLAFTLVTFLLRR